jgi:hypothetical protein
VYLFFRSMNLVIPITSLGPADPSPDDTQMEGQIRAALQPQTRTHTHTCVSIEIGLACCVVAVVWVELFQSLFWIHWVQNGLAAVPPFYLI